MQPQTKPPAAVSDAPGRGNQSSANILEVFSSDIIPEGDSFEWVLDQFRSSGSHSSISRS